MEEITKQFLSYFNKDNVEKKAISRFRESYADIDTVLLQTIKSSDEFRKYCHLFLKKKYELMSIKDQGQYIVIREKLTCDLLNFLASSHKNGDKFRIQFTPDYSRIEWLTFKMKDFLSTLDNIIKHFSGEDAIRILKTELNLMILKLLELIDNSFKEFFERNSIHSYRFKIPLIDADKSYVDEMSFDLVSPYNNPNYEHTINNHDFFLKLENNYEHIRKANLEILNWCKNA